VREGERERERERGKVWAVSGRGVEESTAKLRINKNTLGNSCGMARSVEGTVGYSERVRAISPLSLHSLSISPPLHSFSMYPLLS
jgi:hypothetical protein